MFKGISRGECLLPFAIDSGTRTIEPGRALIMLPDASGTEAAATGMDASWLLEHTPDVDCEIFDSAFVCAHALFVALAVCTVDATDTETGAVSFDSWPGITILNGERQRYHMKSMKQRNSRTESTIIRMDSECVPGGVRCA